MLDLLVYYTGAYLIVADIAEVSGLDGQPLGPPLAASGAARHVVVCECLDTWAHKVYPELLLIPCGDQTPVASVPDPPPPPILLLISMSHGRITIHQA